MVDPAALAPRAEQDQLEACSWLYLEDHRNHIPALEGACAWKCPAEAKGLGKGTAVDRRATCKVITLPRKAQSVGNGKKGSVSKRNTEKCGLRRF